MATGYTDGIVKGMSWEEFVWRCAHAFGANVMMREDPLDAPVETYTASTFYQERLAEATARLAELLTLTPEQTEEKAAVAYAKALEVYQESMLQQAKQREAYAAMLGRAEAWQPPTPDHEGLRRFMIEQITSSMDFDCNLKEATPEPLTGNEWLKIMVDDANWDIEHSAKNQAQEEELTRQRNAWNDALRASVPPPAKKG